ncbi:hypothetical protein M513_13446, partial [Trichuris suis]
LQWDVGEERSFQNTAKSFIRLAISPHTYNSSSTTVAVKCAGRRNAPYGITIRLLEMRECTCVEKGMSMDDICDKWRYPGSDFPQLQIPDYMKSVHSDVLAYMPPQIEKRGFSASFFDNSWPKNRHERTGFGGLGHLGKFGPNYVLYLVVTSKNGYELKIVTEESDEPFALPLFISEDKKVGKPFITKCAENIRDEMGNCSDAELRLIVKRRRVLHEEYLKDRLNTDNAWMEGLIVHLHDSNGRCFGLMSHGRRSRKGRYHWASLPKGTRGIEDFLSSIVSQFVANYK